VSNGFLVNDDRKEELDNKHVQDVDKHVDKYTYDDTIVADIDDNTGIEDLLVNYVRLNKERVFCRHFHQVGHVDFNYFYLHPCVIYGNKNHVSKRCWKRTNIQRKQVNFEFLGYCVGVWNIYYWNDLIDEFIHMYNHI